MKFLAWITPYLIAAAVICGIAFGIYSFGVKNEKARGDLALANLRTELAEDTTKQLADAAAIAKDNQAKAIDAALADQVEKVRIETVFKTITETVTEYVQANPDIDACTVNADGLRIWNNANRGTGISTGAGAAVPTGNMPSHAATGKGR